MNDAYRRMAMATERDRQEFSEDIDITVFRQDLGEPISIEDLELLSGKKRNAKLDEIRDACQQYLRHELQPELERSLVEALGALAPKIGTAPRPRVRRRGAPSSGRGYWFGRRIWRNFSVLTSRNIGVPGGSSAGVRKLVSKANVRVPGL